MIDRLIFYQLGLFSSFDMLCSCTPSHTSLELFPFSEERLSLISEPYSHLRHNHHSHLQGSFSLSMFTSIYVFWKQNNGNLFLQQRWTMLVFCWSDLEISAYLAFLRFLDYICIYTLTWFICIVTWFFPSIK